MNISNEKKAERKQHVDEAINSIGLEGMHVSDEQVVVFNKFINGDIGVDELAAITKEKYGAED